jgi:hypothetical protein
MRSINLQILIVLSVAACMAIGTLSTHARAAKAQIAMAPPR